MQTFLSGCGIAAMLETRGSKKKLEQEERARELQDVRESILHSHTRCKYASVGKEPPPPRNLHHQEPPPPRQVLSLLALLVIY